MSINFRNTAASLVVVLIVGGLLWTWVVVSYDPELTTVNTFEANDTESSVSNSSDDALVSIEITSGEDVLGWDQLGISLEVDGNQYTLVPLQSKSMQLQSQHLQNWICRQ